MAKNPCKYWITDEPSVCVHWDVENTVCIYSASSVPIDSGNVRELRAKKAPYCNLLGTDAFSCDQYEASSENTSSRCVLPDPSRQALKHDSCDLWVHTVASGNVYADHNKPLTYFDVLSQTITVSDNDFWSFNTINGYNNGNCDGRGTTVTCSGYSPYHMGFGYLKPQESTIVPSIEDDIEWCVTSSGLGYRDPLSYDVFNLRALLGRCKWWQNAPEMFSVDPITGVSRPIQFKCMNPDEWVQRYSDYQLTEENGFISPCNGAKPECKGYSSGICWKYCVDDYMAEGDKVLAEQILELRYYIRRERWADLQEELPTLDDEVNYQTLYDASFIDPDLYAWQGTLELSTAVNNQLSALIPAIRNYFLHFEYFDVSYETTTLTAGIPTYGQESEFPDLIRELRVDTLQPVIRTVFDKEASEFSDDVTVTLNPNNIFETSDINHKYLAIWGDTFYTDNYVIAINFDDPDLAYLKYIYDKLLEYKGIYDIRNSFSEDKFEEFYTELDLVLNALILYNPEKIFYSEWDTDTAAFFIYTETFFGDNNIVVFDSCDGTWEYDKINLKKIFNGAVIGQLSFVLEGDGGTVKELPEYRQAFNSSVNDNGYVEFKHFPLRSDDISPGISYVYNDTVVKGNSCFKLYKITVFSNLELTENEVKFIGNSGKAVVILPDYNYRLNNLHRPWEIEGTINLEFYNSDGDLASIEMESVSVLDDSLELNQILLQPKNVTNFTSPCSFTLKLGTKVYSYEKHSFGEVPSAPNYEEVTTHTPINDTSTLSNTNNVYKLSNFEDYGLLISIAYKTQNGRTKGLTRSKLITWVRQPYCRDVEVKYQWELYYRQWDLYPRFRCFYEDTNAVLNKEAGLARRVFGASCGDHDKSLRTPSNPMWYPYDQCASSENYSIISSAHSNITGIMSVFSEESTDGEPVYGNFNLRMLGPVENYGTEESHASIWECNCDYFYFNHEKVSDNVFRGYARYRGALSPEAYERCVFDEGIPPKFGNVGRDQLNSYRSIDKASYYAINTDGSYSELYRWMPAPMYYTKSNIFEEPNTVGMEIYADDDGPYYTQLGLLIVDSSIEGIDINEYVDYDNEYRFEDIFESHISLTTTYPESTPQYVYGAELKPINSYFIYKDMLTSLSTQWAWQGDWKALNRADNKTFIEDYVKGDTTSNQAVYGCLPFISLAYPDYLYDFKQVEFTQVCGEGDHSINFLVSSPSGERTNDNIEPFFLLSLDSGPPRVFDSTGNWLDSSSIPDNITFNGYDITDIQQAADRYDIWNNDPWFSDSTLFQEDVIITTTDAENYNQKVGFYDAYGSYYAKYYKRGLTAELNLGKFDLMPRSTYLVNHSLYEWKFSATPIQSDQVLSNIIPNEYFPATTVLYGAEYVANSPSTLDITFDFGAKTSEYEPKVITSLEVTFYYGKTVVEDNIIIYNVPEFSIYKGVGVDESFTLMDTQELDLASLDTGLYSKTITVELPHDYLTLKDPYRYFKLSFDNTLSSQELKDFHGSAWSTFENKIQITNIRLWNTEVTATAEFINTYERKYYVSKGSHGDLPPQGDVTTGNILTPLSDELSTIYHTDTSAGILGVPNSNDEYNLMNKCRGRLLKEVHVDGEYIISTDIHEIEKEQKKIHDEVAVNKGETRFTMSSITPPEFNQIVDGLGIEFPSWSCVFENTIVCELAPVIPQQNFNDKGHKWSYEHDPPEWTYCGAGIYGNYFNYQYINVATETAYPAYSWMEAQYQAAINRFEAGGWAALFDALSGGSWTDENIIYTGGQTTVDESTLTSMTLP